MSEPAEPEHTKPEHTAAPAPSGMVPRLRAVLLGLAHAVLMAIAFEPWGWPVAFLAPVPMFVLALDPKGRPGRIGVWAALGVAPLWAYTHGWIFHISAAGLYPLVLYLCVYAWAFVLLGHIALRTKLPGIVALVLVWCGLEFFRARVAWSGYPWYLLGHPMISSFGSALAWPAAVGGVGLVSALVALPGAWWSTRGRDQRCVVVPITVGVVFFVWVGVGLARLGSSDAGPTLNVGVVQTNIPQDNRIDWTTAQRLDDWLTMRSQLAEVALGEDRPDVIVLPEGLAPGWTFDPVALDTERARGVVWRITPENEAQAARIADYGARVPATRVVDEILTTQRLLDVPFLVGAAAYDNLRIVTGDHGGLEYDNDAMYNSVFLVENGRVADVWYDKLHLTPFGEVMPYISAVPWLEERLLALGAQGMTFALEPGRSARTIPLHTGERSVELATPICFEATMPAVCRRLANQAAATGRPVLLVNVTNDGWFGTSDRGRRMHGLAARWRCVELGLPMVRCANTGISGHIDARGRIAAELPPRQAATAVFSVRPGTVTTVYARTGDWFGWAAMLAVPALVVGGLRGRNRRDLSKPDGSADGTSGAVG